MKYQIHVLVKFFLLVCLAFLLAHVNASIQVFLLVAMVAMAVLNNCNVLINLIKRVRWLLLILVVVYAFSTPGEYVSDWPIELTPSYEGLSAGLLQASKIITMIALLSMVLSTTTKDALIGGLYQLLKPLNMFKVDAEKFAVRIWLTMHYVEIQDLKKHKQLSAKQVMENFGLYDATQEESLIDEVTISITPLAKLDILFMVMAIASLGYL